MEENLKKTCLYDSHVALGAKMSPFAGFMMPIQYSSIPRSTMLYVMRSECSTCLTWEKFL